MHRPKIGVFEIVLFLVGITAAFLGFNLINGVYAEEGTISWLMVIAIFIWLILLVLFILLSLIVDNSKKTLKEIKELNFLIRHWK